MTSTMLRKVLALDAASCGLFFVACVLVTAVVADITGLPAGVIAAGGWVCLAAGLVFAMLAFSARPSRPLLLLGVLGNALWIVASLATVALLGARMTGLGIAIVLGQAAAVAMLTWLEAKGAGTPPSAAVAA